jgi:hypothetical protein
MCAEGLLQFCYYLDNIPENPRFAIFYLLETFTQFLICLLCLFEVILLLLLKYETNKIFRNRQLTAFFIFGISIFILCILNIVINKINRKHKQQNQKKMF